MRKRKPSRRPAFSRSGKRKAGRPRKLKVKLKSAERRRLKELTRKGRESVRVLKRAQALLLMDRGRSPEEASEAVGLGPTAPRKIVRRYLAGGLKKAVEEPSRPGRARSIKAREEPRLVAMLCGPSPEGRARWTIRLASEEAKERGICNAGPEAIRIFMKAHSLKPWREKNVVHRGEDT